MSKEKKRVPTWVWIVAAVAGLPLALCTGISVLGAAGAVGAAQVAANSDKFMADITSKVAQDAVAQYEIAKKSGDKIQLCVQAGFVTAAFLQAKDEPNYLAWKKTEADACAAAGMPKR
jgi:hypothetical protein